MFAVTLYFPRYFKSSILFIIHSSRTISIIILLLILHFIAVYNFRLRWYIIWGLYLFFPWLNKTYLYPINKILFWDMHKLIPITHNCPWYVVFPITARRLFVANIYLQLLRCMPSIQSIHLSVGILNM